MFPAEKIIFSNQKQAWGLSIVSREEIPQAIEQLKLPAPCPVIVWIGGAGSLVPRYVPPVSQAACAVAEIAQEINAIVVDGATNGGVMAVLGHVYSQGDYKFPLAGVVAEQLVSWSNVPKKQDFSLTRKFRLAVTSFLVGSASMPYYLDPFHTHFFFVPGKRWGAESAWISDIATQLSGDYPSITVLANGRTGGICLQDVEYSLQANRPVVVMQGTGGWADELASQPPRSGMWIIVPADNQKNIVTTILTHLAR